MKFGVREICDVTFKALQTGKMGSMPVVKGQPVLFIESAKTSTIEGAATTIYATGGRGNSRLIAWEGEKTLTFTVEDALLSEVGFAILSGAGLFEASANQVAYVHMTQIGEVSEGKINIEVEEGESISENAPMFVMLYKDGSIGRIVKGTYTNKVFTPTDELEDGEQVFIDFYIEKSSLVTEMQIDAENFAGYYYVEGQTLFRRESDGKDLPANIIFPKVKIQSNFTFTMASTGDPSTFTFTMDAMPAYTFFNRKKKALCAIQVIEDEIKVASTQPVTLAKEDYSVELEEGDSKNS